VKVASIALQLIGLALSLLGVAVVRSWLERATDAAIEARQGVARLWTLRQTQLRTWWARRRGRPVTINRHAADTAMTTDSASATVTRRRMDRETIATRDWLAQLDDHVENLFRRLDADAAARRADYEEWDSRLAAQRAEMRDEILRTTRQGWELIVTGIVCTAAGTLLQYWI
jgi:hypothetical protein